MGNHIRPTNNLLPGKAGIIDGDVIPEDEMGSVVLSKIWRQFEADIVGKTDEIKCATFFPNLNKSLKRDASEADQLVWLKRPKYVRQADAEAKAKASSDAALPKGVPAKGKGREVARGPLPKQATIPKAAAASAAAAAAASSALASGLLDEEVP